MVQGTVVRLQNLPGCTSLIQHNAETCLGVMVLSWPMGYQNRSSVGSESNAGNGGDELIVSAIAYTQLFMSLKMLSEWSVMVLCLSHAPDQKSSWKLTKGSWKSSFSSESREVGISYSIQYTNLIHLLSVSLCFLGTSRTGCSVLCCYLCGQCHHLLLTWRVQQVAMVLESGLITNLKKYADRWREVQYLGYHMGSQQVVS